MAQTDRQSSSRFQALKCPAPFLGSTWCILDRDGANRKVEPYLSSLGHGETGTGMVSSPPFVINADKVTFTICGHDGQLGGQNNNFIALVDARKGEIIAKMSPPQNDAMQERSWDIRKLKVRKKQVRIELRDGNGAGAFAWFGIGRIDAGPECQIDFRHGLPKGWAESDRKADVCLEELTGGIAFKRIAGTYSLIPKSGAVEIDCGFAADRLFFLGCIANNCKPLATYGGIEIHYDMGSPEVFPLMGGFTLDGMGKLLSPCASDYLHVSADPYQHYLVIKPRTDIIRKIRLVAQPNGVIPRITAITCETAAIAESLIPLSATSMDLQETSWIESHGISASTLDLNRVMEAIRVAYQIPTAQSSVGFRKHQIDSAFRSEGVAVADFNGDGKLDIAAGNVYYAGPDWEMVPMLGEPKTFNRHGYSNAFLCFDDDLNNDERADLIVVGFPGKETHWLENPGIIGDVWKIHPAIAQTYNENPAYVDADSDGRRELVFMSGGKCAFAQPGEDPTQPWKARTIANPGDPSSIHGLGVGDLNRDGRLDVLIPDGWWQGPEVSTSSPWPFHAAKFSGGAQLYVVDIDGDGDNDVLGSSPHGYGISWCEQTPEGWKTHDIDNRISQTHSIVVADINRDGLPDFVTGKRFWAHVGHDPGSFQPSVLCWYEQTRHGNTPEWTRHIIDAQSGVGLQFQVVDINGDNKLDIITSNKNGVFYFEQIAPQQKMND